MSTKKQILLRDRGPKESECGHLDTDNVTGPKPKKLWIIRIPNNVSDAIETASSQTNLGTLTMHGSGKECVRSVVLKPYSNSLAPTNFELLPVNNNSSVENDRNGKLYGFSVSHDKTNVKLEGTVSSQYVLKPCGGNLYDEYVQKRHREASQSVSSKKVQTISGSEMEQINTTTGIFVPKSIYQAAKDVEIKQKSDLKSNKRSLNYDKETNLDILKNDLFQIFEKNEKIWIQDIQTQLNCPDKQLREILKDFCDKEKIGNKAYYRLNVDYRRLTK